MPAKSGPDYIDPLFHQKAARTDLTLNFDSWAMSLPSLQALQNLATDKLLMIEGAMGLYDGASGTLTGSTADLARDFTAPDYYDFACPSGNHVLSVRFCMALSPINQRHLLRG